MLLYVMRHGPAEDNSPSGLDADRKLTRDGRELVSVAARELSKRVGPSIARIFASPLVRARETAELVRSALASGGALSMREELVPDEEPPLSLVREVVTLEGDSMIVGHQPGLEHLVRVLVDSAGRGAMPFGFRTAMVMSLEAIAAPPSKLTDPINLGRWRLRGVLDPRQLVTT
jgi:phosphohistidine phosphatase